MLAKTLQKCVIIGYTTPIGFRIHWTPSLQQSTLQRYLTFRLCSGMLVCQEHVGGVKNLIMWFALPSVRALMFMLFSSLYTITHAANDIARREEQCEKKNRVKMFYMFFYIHYIATILNIFLSLNTCSLLAIP